MNASRLNPLVRFATSLIGGVAAGILVHLAILVFTRPHSVYFLPSAWHIVVACTAGILVSLALLRYGSPDSRLALPLACASLAASLLLDRVLSNIPLISRLLPDLWVK